MLGIDVSGYQGKIDWKKVKNDGVEFAILKVIRKDLNPDKQFENNWKGCIAAGMPILAVYNYSYATTVSKSRTDAKKVLEILDGRETKVCLDVEDACQKGLKTHLIDIINAYAKVIQDAGLEFMVYTGLSFYNSYIKPYGKLSCPLWIARYGKNNGLLDESYKPNVPGMVGWQYTSRASVNGITGNVDMNIWYESAISEKETVDSTNTSTQKVSETKMPTIKKGSSGKAVRIWQTIIEVPVDGAFGAKTQAATIAFQKAHGLVQDGIVGKNTWKAGLESLL